MLHLVALVHEIRRRSQLLDDGASRVRRSRRAAARERARRRRVVLRLAIVTSSWTLHIHHRDARDRREQPRSDGVQRRHDRHPTRCHLRRLRLAADPQHPEGASRRRPTRRQAGPLRTIRVRSRLERVTQVREVLGMRAKRHGRARAGSRGFAASPSFSRPSTESRRRRPLLLDGHARRPLRGRPASRDPITIGTPGDRPARAKLKADARPAIIVTVCLCLCECLAGPGAEG